MEPEEEATPTVAQQSEPSVHDVILEMLDEDPDLDGAVKDAVLDALADVGEDTDTDEKELAPTFLTTISVAGFRGIGRQARLDLYPDPNSGLTVPKVWPGLDRWNCGDRCCPTTSWVACSTADRPRSTTRWRNCSVWRR